MYIDTTNTKAYMLYALYIVFPFILFDEKKELVGFFSRGIAFAVVAEFGIA